MLDLRSSSRAVGWRPPLLKGEENKKRGGTDAAGRRLLRPLLAAGRRAEPAGLTQEQQAQRRVRCAPTSCSSLPPGRGARAAQPLPPHRPTSSKRTRRKQRERLRDEEEIPVGFTRTTSQLLAPTSFITRKLLPRRAFRE